MPLRETIEGWLELLKGTRGLDIPIIGEISLGKNGILWLGMLAMIIFIAYIALKSYTSWPTSSRGV